MEEASVLIDASAFISNKAREGTLSVVTVIEIMEWALRNYNELVAKGETSRALGYMNLIASLLLVAKRVIELKGQELMDMVYYVIEKGLDPAYAYLVVLGKRLGVPILTTDKDFERVKDEVNVIDP